MSYDTPNHTKQHDNNVGQRVRMRTVIIVSVVVAGGLFMLLLISIISLRWLNPPFTSFTLREDWHEFGTERYNLREWWTPHDKLPHHLKWAVIASEDQNFHHHRGFDIESIREALEERREGVRRRGASTISQQVAKNLYLWPGESFVRKGIEAGITVLIELFWPKERILEVYLNIAEFGPGIFGVGKDMALERFSVGNACGPRQNMTTILIIQNISKVIYGRKAVDVDSCIFRL
jgi:monofunctional glycosyltransferase